MVDTILAVPRNAACCSLSVRHNIPPNQWQKIGGIILARDKIENNLIERVLHPANYAQVALCIDVTLVLRCRIVLSL